MYFKRQLAIEASLRQNGLSPIFKRGDKITNLNDIAAIAEGGVRRLVIPIPTTDLDLMQSNVTTGKILYIETDTEITVKLDDTSDTGFLVTPVVSTRSDLDDAPGTFYLEGTYTHVYISIAGTSGNANIVVATLGA